MSPATGLSSSVRVAFASGTAQLNADALLQFAADTSTFDLPLFICSEFPPEFENCPWIPFHVHRSLAENRAALTAALNGRRIEIAGLFVAPGTDLGAMRWLALLVAAPRIVVYDSSLHAKGLTELPYWLASSAFGLAVEQFREGGRGRKWIRRIFHPSDAEIPVRARLAQLKARAAVRRSSPRPDSPGLMVVAGHLRAGVSVVVPSRDGRELLATMLDALVPQLQTGEIIVVDNGSSDGTAAWLAQEYPAIRVIVHGEPLSFAGAVNAGVAVAENSHLLLLNNDMVAAPGFIDALEQAFVEIPRLFCATAQIFFPEGVRREETGKAVWRRDGELDFPVRCDDPLPGEDLTWVLYGSGGCSLFDTAMLRQLGGVSERYDPAYVEDMDFGYRAWKRGWPTVFVAGAKVEHRHRATTSRFYSAEDLDFFTERNYLRFVETAIGSPELFLKLWNEGVRRLQLLAMDGSGAALRTLRHLPRIGARPPAASGLLSEVEILALSNGDAAAFPGRPVRPEARRLIVATPYMPYPLSHGGAVRIFNLLREAAKQHDIILIAFVQTLATPPEELRALCSEIVLVRRHGSHLRHQTERPDMVEEFESNTFRACLKQAAWRWNPAIVQLEFTWLAQYAQRYGTAKTILVEHDITFDLQRQLLEAGTAEGAALWELRQQHQKWERFERSAWRDVDCVVTMSDQDAAAVEGAAEVVAIPNGVDCDRFRAHGGQQDPKRLLFIGSFAHRPNVLAVEWFLREVWPLLD
ncbi:MAG: glycosyl transferase, family 2, partial [Bryobacterales bacterium]|nr:glycosyl transferase, family 2 [Bryobacterales bacterium]